MLCTFCTHIYTHSLYTDKTRAHTHVLECQVAGVPRYDSMQGSEKRYIGGASIWVSERGSRA